MVSDGTEFAVGDIERLFDEARPNTKAKNEKWEKYYNRRRRDGQIKVNDWVLIKTHPLSSATKKVVAKFKPKFEGPYRVLEVKNNNIVIRRSIKKRGRAEETVMPNTSGCNLRPRNVRRVESPPSMEMKTQQGRPVRAGNSKGKQYSPYIEEQARSGNKNTRRRGNQQQKDQEKKRGANTHRSIFLEVLVRDVNYKS
ncbi:uncharacterized protein TNCV_157571 [Trichonephila clavipes]|nr:uncharacterized protein TNCV_157571 [Trichonephila clavipes]